MDPIQLQIFESYKEVAKYLAGVASADKSSFEQVMANLETAVPRLQDKKLLMPVASEIATNGFIAGWKEAGAPNTQKAALLLRQVFQFKSNDPRLNDFKIWFKNPDTEVESNFIELFVSDECGEWGHSHPNPDKPYIVGEEEPTVCGSSLGAMVNLFS